MGKIFGISDLPVSTIMSPFEPVVVPGNPSLSQITEEAKQIKSEKDLFIPKEQVKARRPGFISMRNGFGKLMKHFSGKITK